MASEVDICNLALGYLGDSATVSSIDPPEGSTQAEHCARFYPVARDTLLQAHPWNFSTRRKQLALVQTPITPDPHWLTVYALPTDCLEPMSVLPPGGYDTENQEFEIETADDGTLRILCNVEQAVLRYKARVLDTTKFPPLFINALSRLLASYLAGPIIKGDAGTAESKQQLSAYQLLLSQAVVSDTNARKVNTGYGEHLPSWMAARGTPTGLGRNRFRG